MPNGLESLPIMVMTFNVKVKRYVTAVALTGSALLIGSLFVHGPHVDPWAVMILLVVGCLLEVSRTQNKAGGLTGSLVFVFHLAVGLILGVFWGALTAGIVKAIAQIFDRAPMIKAVFNVAERVASVSLTFLVYAGLGGQFPPQFVDPLTSSHVPFNTALLEIGIFLSAALVYFIANSIAVNVVVALASERPVVSTWRANTVWVLGYDLAASSLALMVTRLFLLSNESNGLAKLGFLFVVLPLILVRHIYGKLNGLEAVYKELDRAYEELEQNVREQLAMMVKAIEARDPYTSGHSRRVRGLSSAIAKDLGLTADEVEQIENAALLHDVGKIHEEFAPLLQKEGKLTAEEWEVMKTHSVRSADLVALFSRFQGYVVACVRGHHERWDGGGYPDQLRGEMIPLGARIITIADTIDAMTTNRPYRDALPIEVVLSELNRGRNTQFDSGLVDIAVNSVAVRRLIIDPASILEEDPIPRTRARSHANARKSAQLG